MSQAISNLAAGSLVRDPNSKYLGAAIVWKIAAQNHAGYPANSTTIIANKILISHMVDAKEATNTDSNRRSLGNNRYKFSNLRQWLNTGAAASAWYTAQHSADAPPTDANNYSGKAFGYDDEAGFMAGLSADFINNLLETTLSVELASVDGGDTESVTDKIFLASADEVGLGAGAAFSIFPNNASRIGYYTPEGVAYHNIEAAKAGYPLITETTARYWWLRNAYASNSYNVRDVYPSGALDYNLAHDGSVGVRPLCNLPSSILVSDTPDANGVYDLSFPVDTAPHISGADTNQGNIYGGFDYEYSVTDKSESDTVTAVEKVDGNQIRSYTVTLGQVNQFGLSREAWLALSYGNHTAIITVTDTESQSKTRTITFTKHQAAPTITGSDGSLGDIVESLTYNYTVNDLNGVDGDTVTVVEKLDGVKKRSYTATLGMQTAFTIPAANWGGISYGNHTIVITATDSYGLTATRTETFVKRNYQPAISGSDTDLGTKTAGFAYSYTVYDQNFGEGDTVTVVEKLDGVRKRSYTLSAQATKEFTVTGEAFLRLGNASHTMSITAVDAQGETVTRTVTFTKQQSMSVTLAEAVANDGDKEARPVEATLTLDAYVPTGATIKVEICNNGFDAAPTWEDCTIEAVNGQNHAFTNETKTADNWGVNVRVNIEKATATKTPSITQILVKFKY